MPWEGKDARRHNKKITDEGDAQEWASIANGVLSDSGDEGLAIRSANAHIRDKHGKKHKKGKGK